MRFARRWVTAGAIVCALSFGGWIVAEASHAQPDATTATTGAVSAPVAPTTTVSLSDFVTSANAVCANVISTVQQEYATFQNQIKAAAANPQVNPLQVTDQFLQQYMDILDGVGAMQNSVFSQLQALPEPSAQQSTLASLWQSFNAALIAQNQFNKVWENEMVIFLNNGYIVGELQANGSPQNAISVQQQATNFPGITTTTTAATTTTAVTVPSVLGPTGSSTTTTAAPVAQNQVTLLQDDLVEEPILQNNITNLAKSVNSTLASLGLNQCEEAGLLSQIYLSVGNKIPNAAEDYVNTYAKQSTANLTPGGTPTPISLAQVLQDLPAPYGDNQVWP